MHNGKPERRDNKKRNKQRFKSSPKRNRNNKKRSNEKNLKLEGEELVSLSVKQTLKRLLISCAVIVVLSLAAVFVCGGNVAQTCLALIIAVAVNTLSAIFAAPRLWMSLNK